jgi:hypothetical protein
MAILLAFGLERCYLGITCNIKNNNAATVIRRPYKILLSGNPMGGFFFPIPFHSQYKSYFCVELSIIVSSCK